MHRRSFLGVLPAVVAFPWTSLKAIASYSRGWQTLRQTCGAYKCSALYRWTGANAVEVEWMQTACPRTGDLQMADSPALVLRHGFPATLSFEMPT